MAVEQWTDERLNQLADAVAANTQSIAELKVNVEKVDVRLEA